MTLIDVSVCDSIQSDGDGLMLWWVRIVGWGFSCIPEKKGRCAVCTTVFHCTYAVSKLLDNIAVSDYQHRRM